MPHHRGHQQSSDGASFPFKMICIPLAVLLVAMACWLVILKLIKNMYGQPLYSRSISESQVVFSEQELSGRTRSPISKFFRKLWPLKAHKVDVVSCQSHIDLESVENLVCGHPLSFKNPFKVSKNLADLPLSRNHPHLDKSVAGQGSLAGDLEGQNSQREASPEDPVSRNSSSPTFGSQSMEELPFSPEVLDPDLSEVCSSDPDLGPVVSKPSHGYFGFYSEDSDAYVLAGERDKDSPGSVNQLPVTEANASGQPPHSGAPPRNPERGRPESEDKPAPAAPPESGFAPRQTNGSNGSNSNRSSNRSGFSSEDDALAISTLPSASEEEGLTDLSHIAIQHSSASEHSVSDGALSGGASSWGLKPIKLVDLERDSLVTQDISQDLRASPEVQDSKLYRLAETVEVVEGEDSPENRSDLSSGTSRLAGQISPVGSDALSMCSRMAVRGSSPVSGAEEDDLTSHPVTGEDSVRSEILNLEHSDSLPISKTRIDKSILAEVGATSGLEPEQPNISGSSSPLVDSNPASLVWASGESDDQSSGLSTKMTKDRLCSVTMPIIEAPETISQVAETVEVEEDSPETRFDLSSGRLVGQISPLGSDAALSSSSRMAIRGSTPISGAEEDDLTSHVVSGGNSVRSDERSDSLTISENTETSPLDRTNDSVLAEAGSSRTNDSFFHTSSTHASTVCLTGSVVSACGLEHEKINSLTGSSPPSVVSNPASQVWVSGESDDQSSGRSTKVTKDRLGAVTLIPTIDTSKIPQMGRSSLTARTVESRLLGKSLFRSKSQELPSSRNVFSLGVQCKLSDAESSPSNSSQTSKAE